MRHADRPSVNADHHARAAGRDFNEHCDQRLQLVVQLMIAAADPSRPPRWDSPHVADCTHCGRKWLSKMAVPCLTCGFSVQLAREKVFRWELTILTAVVLGVVTVYAPSLGEAAAARSTAASTVYALGSLLHSIGVVLAGATTWVWWRRRRDQS
jgi:ribosomal protein L37E